MMQSEIFSGSLKWCDTHCHLDCEPLSSVCDEVLTRAREAGVAGFVVPGIRGAVNSSQLPSFVGKAWGFHPANILGLSSAELISMFEKSPYHPWGIGECGLDIHVPVSMDQQIALFRTQIELAAHHRLPLLIHLRGQWEKALRLLKAHGSMVPWLMHTFSGSAEVARQFLNEGAFISFSGALCHEKARKTPEVARLVPDDRLLLETDSPDLKPPFWDGSWNEPASLPGIGQKLADLRHCSIERIAELTWQNACRLFPSIA